jgi:hypothetical protein
MTNCHDIGRVPQLLFARPLPLLVIARPRAGNPLRATTEDATVKPHPPKFSSLPAPERAILFAATEDATIKPRHDERERGNPVSLT